MVNKVKFKMGGVNCRKNNQNFIFIFLLVFILIKLY